MGYAEVIGCYRDVPDDTPVRAVLVVPLDPESVARIEDAVFSAMADGGWPQNAGRLAVLALRAIGVLRKPTPIRPSRSSGTGRGAGKKT